MIAYLKWKFNYNLNPFFVPLKDWIIIDQSAHFILGILISYGFSFVNPILGLTIPILVGFIREFIQHLGRPIGHRSRTDMLVWFTGAIVGSLL